MSETPAYLSNHLLIAMPALADPNFVQTVTFVCEHNAQGALGIVINRALDMRLDDVFEQLGLPTGAVGIGRHPVLQGGPVQTDRGFVLHRGEGDWASTLKVSERVHVTTSRDILDALARGDGPREAFIALGYAGWGAGQLEQELLENAWLSVPADERILFETPVEERWLAAGRLLGIDLATISPDAGHA
ncbi:MAG TPA: YqgE/AlgH family protein [Steroidobacteraceae bacterium]|nr:YqgE/AlgH family protein [Steroidobacteraceae bacterium]